MSALERQAGYRPGVPGPGSFLPFHDGAELVAQRAEATLAHARHAFATRRGARRRAVWSLAAVCALAAAGDVAAADGSWTFLRVTVPVSLLATFGVMVLTHPAPGTAAADLLRGSNLAKMAGGCFLALVVGAMVGFVAVVLTDGDLFALVKVVAAVAALGLLRVLGRGFGLPDTAGPSPARLEAALAGLRLLEDELPAGKAATGWIDLSGPEHPPKRIAAGTTASGWPTQVFRDEWFHASGVLRDGSRLRVAAVETRRVKGSRWKSSPGRRKLKPGSTRESHSLEMRLRAARGGTASVSVPCSDPFTAREMASGFAALREAVRTAPTAAAEPPPGPPAQGSTT